MQPRALYETTTLVILMAALVNDLTTPTLALDNGYGRTPGMGWNSDYCTNCSGPPGSNGFGGEHFVRHIADFLNSSGLQAKGYRFVNMDASWDTATRDPRTGDLVPDPELWPSTIEKTIEYIHSKNLGFGLYGDKGSLDCAKNPGSLGHEAQDARFLARIKVDWWKEDSCYSPAGTEADQIAAYAKMRDALNATGRKIWFALCGWKTFYATDAGGGQQLGNSWRIGPDTGTGWSSVMINAAAGLHVASSRAPGPSMNGGAWSDGSLLLNPGMGHTPEDRIDNARHRSMFSLWCILNFNLLMTGNLSALDPFVLETWGNADLIAVNQDTHALPLLVLNISTTLRSEESSYTQAHLEECGGEPEQQVWVRDSPMEGFWRNPHLNLCLNVKGCGSELIYDHCTVTGGTCAGAHSYGNEQFDLSSKDHGLRSRLSDGKCATQDPSGLLNMQTCGKGSVDSAQAFFYSNDTKQLTSLADGRCLTASSNPNPPQPSKKDQWVISRELKDGSVVLLFLNNGNNATTVTCDAACFEKIGVNAVVPSSSNHVNVVDLWNTGAKRAPLVMPNLAVDLNGAGASAVFKLSSG